MLIGLQHQLNFETLAAVSDFQIRFAGIDDAHIILIALLADAADI